MTALLAALQGIVDPRKVIRTPILLREEAPTSRCEPISVRYAGECWALRLDDQDHLRLLKEIAADRSVRRLPDYLVFSAAMTPPRRPEEEVLQVLACELKSSATGAESGRRQVELGILLGRYLVELAAHDQTRRLTEKNTWCAGLIASPEFPSSLRPKGRTRPGKVDLPRFPDTPFGLPTFQVPSGGEIRLEDIYG